MAKYIVEDSSLSNIGSAIRTIRNEETKYRLSEIPGIIEFNMLSVPDPIVAGDYPIYGITTSEKIESSEYTDLGIYQFTALRAGTYRFKWCCMKPAIGGTSGNGTALFHNDAQIYENLSFSSNVNYNVVDVSMAQGDVVSVRAKHSGMYSTYIYGVSVCIDWNGGNAFFNG